MKTFLLANRWYLLGLLIVLVLWAILLTIYPAESIILWINHRHQPALDLFFKYITHAGEAYTYYALMVAGLFIAYRFALTIPLIGLVVTLLSNVLKTTFDHPRPYFVFKWSYRLQEIHLVDGVKMMDAADTSFPSGHTLSAFAIFGFCAFMSSKTLWKLFFLSIATLVGVSRIYLFQHYLADVCAGAFIGTMVATVFYLLHIKLPIGNHWWNKSLMKLFQ